MRRMCPRLLTSSSNADFSDLKSSRLCHHYLALRVRAGDVKWRGIGLVPRRWRGRSTWLRLWENEVLNSASIDATIVVSDSAIRAYFCHHRRLTANAIIRHPGPFSRTNGILLAAPVQVHVGDTQRSHLFLCMAMVVINLAANLKLGEEYLVAIHHCLHLLSEAVVCPPHTCAVPQVHEPWTRLQRRPWRELLSTPCINLLQCSSCHRAGTCNQGRGRVASGRSGCRQKDEKEDLDREEPKQCGGRRAW
mmetsp:Transcript_11940/g.30087  ORF Transcript_11940/g.30087 Transcript_11940/m.30087 type:complete len:249 (-) Transcript_11940:450-1196(-)